MTYLELRDHINGMTAKQLMMEVVTYSGDIDDTIRVIGTSLNTDDDMGGALDCFVETQTFLVLE